MCQVNNYRKEHERREIRLTRKYKNKSGEDNQSRGERRGILTQVAFGPQANKEGKEKEINRRKKKRKEKRRTERKKKKEKKRNKREKEKKRRGERKK